MQNWVFDALRSSLCPRTWATEPADCSSHQPGLVAGLQQWRSQAAPHGLDSRP